MHLRLIHNPSCILAITNLKKMRDALSPSYSTVHSYRICTFSLMISFRIASKHIEQAKLREITDDDTNLHDHSILEKLLRLDKQTAHVMALDMLTAGIDTVSERSKF